MLLCLIVLKCLNCCEVTSYTGTATTIILNILLCRTAPLQFSFQDSDPHSDPLAFLSLRSWVGLRFQGLVSSFYLERTAFEWLIGPQEARTMLQKNQWVTGGLRALVLYLKMHLWLVFFFFFSLETH